MLARVNEPPETGDFDELFCTQLGHRVRSGRRDSRFSTDRLVYFSAPEDTLKPTLK